MIENVVQPWIARWTVVLQYTARAWAEDRATRGRDPSAGSGAKTGVGGRTPPLGIPGLAPKR